jgi:DNA-binding transcriptional regulator YiaG
MCRNLSTLQRSDDEPVFRRSHSRRIGVSAATLRNWEQGRRKPEGPARILLALLERNPRIVEETLSDARA